MVNTRVPTNPVQKRGLWPPKNGRRYPVNDNDTWRTVADRERVDVWGLIHFNFATYVPEEVNWYLRELVGCRISLDQGRNYAFAGADKSKGAIYIPPVPVVLPPAPLTWLDRLKKLRYEVEHSNDPSRDRFLCMLESMENKRDDRVIFWEDIAPSPDIPAPLGVTRGHRSMADQTWMFDTLQTWQDVAALDLGDGTNSRKFVLSFHRYLFGTSDGSLESLRKANISIVNTISMLDKWANQGVGGSSAMPREYRAIKDFVQLGLRSPGSVMNCFALTGS